MTAGRPGRATPRDRDRRRLARTAAAATLPLLVTAAVASAAWVAAAGGGAGSPPGLESPSGAPGGQESPANPCLQCHEGIAAQAGLWKGRRFSHTPHLERAGLDCSFCHTTLQSHGGITLAGPAACDDCHHGRTAAGSCDRCHRGSTGAPDRVFETDVGRFDHTRHVQAGFACSDCHTGRSMSAAALDCVVCHGAHHRPEAGCLACHEPGSVPAHPMAVHEDGCVACHGESSAWIERWTREVCTVCHAERTSHYADRPCAVCHIVPEPVK